MVKWVADGNSSAMREPLICIEFDGNDHEHQMQQE
jgi:hypothetical protein